MKNEIDSAHRLLTRGVALIIAVTLIGTAYLIWRGETSTELWATWETINGAPSVEIVP